MTFFGTDNQTVELFITNYEFPGNNKGDWDGNWLNIHLIINSKLGNWEIVDPSLTTFEFQSMIEWFKELSENHKLQDKKLEFTEPNLSFELLNDFESVKKEIRIKFESESRPKSAKDEQEYYVDCLETNAELLRISRDLDQELDKYPERKTCP